MTEVKKDTYSFAQQPLPISNSKKPKYRDPFPKSTQEHKRQYNNIMWDRSIHRGNTYAAQVVPLSAQAEAELKKRRAQAERRRRMELERQRRLEEQRKEIVSTPRPVQGRKHTEIQTEDLLEEITDRKIEADIETQTDPFMDRPASPIFIPKKYGIDAETQIENDLFNFDVEVQPILEVIVGKTLEQSMLEVMEEEEMKALKEHQRIFEQKRNAELAETQQLENAERRRFEEKERRKKQERERIERERETREKLASRAFAKNFLSNLENRVFTNLEEEGYFYDVVEREVTNDFMPWLIEKVHEHIEEKKNCRKLVDGI